MSIINLRGYGNLKTLENDKKELFRILDNQGTALVIDVVAEYIGQAVLKYKLSGVEAKILREKILKDLENQINERI